MGSLTSPGRAVVVSADDVSTLTAKSADWLPNVRHIRSPNYDARPRGVAVELIVIHAISLPPGEFGGGYIEKLFTNSLLAAEHPYFREIEGLAVSAHFLIDRRGVVTQFVGIDQRAWHAGQSAWRGRTACNDFSIGIELEGCDALPFTDRQYDALASLIDDLHARLPTVAADCLAGHSDIAPSRKTDPGPCFDWARLRQTLPR